MTLNTPQSLLGTFLKGNQLVENSSRINRHESDWKLMAWAERVCPKRSEAKN